MRYLEKIKDIFKKYRIRREVSRLGRIQGATLPKNGERHYLIDSAYVALGRRYDELCEKAKRFNKKDSLRDVPFELIYAHSLLLGAIASFLEENNGNPVPSDDNTRRKFVLIMSFIQGISLCEQTILKSSYIQAGALLRQEYEITVLLNEITKGIRKDKKLINAKNAPWESKGLYDPLSKLHHLHEHRFVESIVGYNTTWGDYSSALPQYRKDKAIAFYATHVGLVFNIANEMECLYQQFVPNLSQDERQKGIMETVRGILMKHRVLTLPIEVADLDRGSLFYEAVLGTAGYVKSDYNTDKEIFFHLKDENLQNNLGDVVLIKGDGGVTKYGYLLIEVREKGAVDEFYKTALANGGKENGQPPHSVEDGYQVIIFDPDGNGIGVIAVA